MRLVCCLAVAAALACAQEGGGRGGNRDMRAFLGLSAAPDPAAAARGEKLYGPNCAFCHGARANGAEGPSLVRSPLVLHDERGELIGPVLIKGRAEKGMPPFPNLTAEQISDIAQFLHLRVDLVANRGTYRRGNVVTGDPKKGEAYFNGAGGCARCHSAQGDLAHVATKFPQPDRLQNRFLYPGGGPQRATITTAEGAKHAGVVKAIDDFTISIVDPAGEFHSWPREAVKVEIADPLAAHRELLAKYTDEDMHNITAYLVTLK